MQKNTFYRSYKKVIYILIWLLYYRYYIIIAMNFPETSKTKYWKCCICNSISLHLFICIGPKCYHNADNYKQKGSDTYAKYLLDKQYCRTCLIKNNIYVNNSEAEFANHFIYIEECLRCTNKIFGIKYNKKEKYQYLLKIYNLKDSKMNSIMNLDRIKPIILNIFRDYEPFNSLINDLKELIYNYILFQ